MHELTSKLAVKFEEAKKLIFAASRIVIISHRGPDGDTIGANLALRMALKYQWNKEVVSACIDPLPKSACFLPEAGEYKNDFDQTRADLIVMVDCGSCYMSKFHETKPDLFSGRPPVINIDHHASNDLFGKVNIVYETAASATHILFYFLMYCGFKIDRRIATCLLNGLYFDTGSFMHSNTNEEVLNVASELVWRGADFKNIARQQFHTMRIPQLKIYGTIMERAHINSRKMAVSILMADDLQKADADLEDTTGAIDYLNSICEGDFSCLLHEDSKGLVKGSLRTRVENIDLSKLAGMFDGGGHKKAAGFSVPGRLVDSGKKIKIIAEDRS